MKKGLYFIAISCFNAALYLYTKLVYAQTDQFFTTAYGVRYDKTIKLGFLVAAILCIPFVFFLKKRKKNKTEQ